MEPNERLKHLRKNILEMNQEQLATRLNMSRSNLGSLEIGRIKITNRVMADMERIGINSQWIKNGTEPIFMEKTDPNIDDIIKTYLTLDKDNRKYLRGYMQRLLEEQNEKSK